MRILLSLFFALHLSVVIGQSWEAATAPPEFLSDHSFGFSLAGLGYLVAGNEEFIGPTDRFMQYDPVADTWSELDPFPGPARGYAIGDVWDGKAYFGFGTSPDSLLKDLWVFDPDSMRWSELASCPCDARTHPAMVALNGKIFIGLGSGNAGNMNDWWEYDIATDQWTQKTNFPDTRRHHPYQFGVGDYVYVGFGHGQGIFNEWYRYDPATDSWLQMADLPAEGRVAGTQFSHKGKGYALSGDGEDHLSMEEGEFWEYDPETNTWLQLEPHPGKSRWAPSSFIIDDVAYLFNGTTYFEGVGSVYVAEAYKFDLEAIASDEDMLVIGKQWIFEYIEYSISFPFSDTTIETITITKDTLINSKTYKKLELSTHPSCWNTGDVEYLREEGEQIYRLSRNLNDEFLMIDFNEDSTYTMLFDNAVGGIDTGTVIIDSFGTEIAFDGTLLDVQYLKILNNQSFDDDTQYKVYRKAGFYHPGLLFPDVGTGLCDLQSDITLRCLVNGQDTIHFTYLDCFELQVISSVKPIIPNAFSISPNPANNELNINVEGINTSSLSWKITNAFGQIIKAGKFKVDSGVEKIETADIPSGLYVLTVGQYSRLMVIQK